jgi:muconate cycloisomerase
MLLHAQGHWLAFTRPLVISGHSFSGQQVLRLSLLHAGRETRAEAAGVFYLDDTIDGLLAQAHAMAGPLARCDTTAQAWHLLADLPAGGVRNALDWALWQHEAAARGQPAWALAHLAGLRPLSTTITLGVDTPAAMAAAAAALTGALAIKLKLDGGPDDPARVLAVRDARPDVRLMVDVNQGWDMARLMGWMATMVRARVEAIEQPLPMGADEALATYRSPIPLAADESLQTLADLDAVAARYQVANIKLDKCGGLSEALVLAHGLRIMVGCMGGSSLAMQPAFIAGQFADLVDLDAPLLLAEDLAPCARYRQGRVDFDGDIYLPVAATVAATTATTTGTATTATATTTSAAMATPDA